MTVAKSTLIQTTSANNSSPNKTGTRSKEPVGETITKVSTASRKKNWSDNYLSLNGQPAPFDWPTLDDVITEDETPVDNIFSEKQQRLLTEPLYASWDGPGKNRPFVALANVGLFYARGENPFVPDIMLSLDVYLPQEEKIWIKRNRSYFIHKYGKAPEIAVEIVSNKVGQEQDQKLEKYAEIGIKYYVIFDPDEHLSKEQLQIYALNDEKRYEKTNQAFFPEISLGLTRWKGKYENMTQKWLRWTDLTGTLIATGAEQAERAKKAEQWAELTFQRVMEEHQRAEEERQRAEEERQRAEEERQRAEQALRLAEHYAAQLRALGIELESE